MNSHIRLRITGRVQGVFYRQSTAEKARELGLTGFVMNMDDGSVVLEAAGPQESLQALRQWCRSGPPLAKVTMVSDEDPKFNGAFTGFEIRRD
jgi:acylphosphatase